MSKRIITIIVFVLALSLFASAAEITSADDMLTLMNTPSMWADNYVLTTDIDLGDATNGLAQAPIGNGTTKFTGTFNGGGHTVSGLSLTGYTTNNVALFGNVSNATIENLAVSGTVSSTGKYIAGIIGGVDGGSVTVKNCVNRCTVNGLDSTAGIIGRVNAGSGTAYIFGCKNEGDITGSNNYTGGIIGTSSQDGASITVEQCLNTGSVSGGAKYVGGIVGYWRVYSASKNKCVLQDCINTGSVCAKQNVVGGIMGTGNAQNYAYILTRCFNSGSITGSGSTYLRPIAGATSKATYSAGQMTYCYYSSTDNYTTDSTGYSAANETYVADVTVAASFAGLGNAWVVVDGYAPELKAFHSHVASGEYAVTGDEHHTLCYCGEIMAKEEHTFTDGVCTVCGAEKIECAHENKYDVVDTVPTCTDFGVKYEYCPDCKSKVSGDIEIEKDFANHIGKVLTMAKVNGNVVFTCECGNTVYTAEALDTVYVSQNGAELVGNLTEIGTRSNPFKNFTEAMQFAAYLDKDVTVEILDSAEVPENYATPDFDATITITGGTFVTNNRFILNGKIVFENITVKNNVALVIVAQENKLVMGEGITISGSDTYLCGGYASSLNTNSDIPKTGFSTDITIRSGRYHSVGGGNRFLDGKYSGTIKMTIGKTNPADTLDFYSTLVTGSLNYDGGDGVVATVIFDGNVDNIDTYRPIGHAAAGVAGRFDVDIIVKGYATIKAGTADLRGHDYTLNVYADSRVDGAEEFAAAIVGAENVQPYKRYCLKVNGEHPDANGDSICDNCDASIECAHESGEWFETSAANCVNKAEYVWYCLDCKELVEEITKTGDDYDTDNHASEDFTWQYADGKYFFNCTACAENVESDVAPTVYVSQSGNNALSGITPEKAVATLEEAVARIAKTGGTVKIVDSYVISGEINLPKYEKPITISGHDSYDEYIHGGFTTSALTVLSLGGETKFDNISFNGDKTFIFVCNWNNVEFGRVEVVNKANCHIVVGGYKITENDNEAKDVTLKISEGATVLISREGTLTRNKFYTNIYLGSTFGADGVLVANKKVTFDATDALIEVLYTMSTTSTYKNTPTVNCETTVNLYGNTLIEKGRTGDYNVGYADSTASLTKQTLNFFENSNIGSNYYVRNAENTVINVSTYDEGRTAPIRTSFMFYAFGSYALSDKAMTVELNYGTHSFDTSVDAPCVFSDAANAHKEYTESKSDECVYTEKVIAAATPTTTGTKLYSCYCGRSYKEEYTYSCEEVTHLYIAKNNGGYDCSVCGESFANYSGENVFAATVAGVENGKITATVSISGNFTAALVDIAIPAGYEFDGATLPENDSFMLVGSVNGGSYLLTVISKNGMAENADLSFELALVGEGESVIDLTVTELYDANGNSLVATTVDTEIPDSVVRGDVDRDGIITVLDALMVIKHVVNNTAIGNADMNGDGKVGLIDAIRVFKEIVK